MHPGDGFLSERADFAQAVADAGMAFIGPTRAQLARFGNQASVRRLALPFTHKCPHHPMSSLGGRGLRTVFAVANSLAT